MANPGNKVVSISHLIKELLERKFTGYVKISFSRGAVRRVEKFEEILRKDEPLKR